jgi:hypothetical protein
MKKIYTILFSLFFVFTNCTKEDPEPVKVYILSVTASPTNSESVTIKNNSGNTVDVSGWIIGDLNNSNAYSIPSGNSLNQGQSFDILCLKHWDLESNNSGEDLFKKK